MMMQNSIYLPADTREFKDLGFIRLHASFRPYLAPERRHFGALITIDDAVVTAGSKGFGLHSHQNVEIVTFIHKGSGRHVDPVAPSNSGQFKAVGAQAITAGSGIIHNEENSSETEVLNALQIWFLPRENNLAPAYAKREFLPESYTNRLVCVVSPDGADGSLSIQQDVYLHYGYFDRSNQLTYSPRMVGNGTLIYVIDGEVEANGILLHKGDGFGITQGDPLSVSIPKQSEFLIFDVPQ